MRWNTRVGAVLLAVGVSLLLPIKAEAQEGGGGFWDWIRDLGPPFKGVGITVYEVCIPGFVLGGSYSDCPDPIRKRGEATRAARVAATSRWQESAIAIRAAIDAARRDRDPSTRLKATDLDADLSERMVLVDNWLSGTQPAQAIEIGEALTLPSSAESRRTPAYLRRDVEIVAWQTRRLLAAAEQLRLAASFLQLGIRYEVDVAVLDDLVKPLNQLRTEGAFAEVKDKRVVFTFLRLNTGYSRGTAADDGGADRLNRVVINPMLSFEVETAPYVKAYFEGGITYNYFYGDGFDNFWRHSFDTGMGLRLELGETPFFVDGGVRFRYFATPFTTQDFGGPVQTVPQGGEWVWGPVLGLGVHLDGLIFGR